MGICKIYVEKSTGEKFIGVTQGENGETIFNVRPYSTLEKITGDVFMGILGGIKFSHVMPEDIADTMNGESYTPHSKPIYFTTKMATTALIGLKYYALAKEGHPGYMVIPAITNTLNLLKIVSRAWN